MESAVTKASPSSSSYHHQRAPRTPESYFNVPESIALLNIVKSERIQSAFQSNRKNHASVWEMVAEVLNRFSARKRSAKQCCNRYENLKKIYTQLKKNPERHVRRNWPYMFLFKEIEEQRGECWGSNGKRLTLITKNHKELSYYHRRRQAAELSLLMGGGKDANAMPSQLSLLPLNMQGSGGGGRNASGGGAALSISVGPPPGLTHSNEANANGKLEQYLQPNHFVEAQLNESGFDDSMGAGVPHLQQMPRLMRATSSSLDDEAKRHHDAMAAINGNGALSAEARLNGNSDGGVAGHRGIQVAAMASQALMNCDNSFKEKSLSHQRLHHDPFDKDCNGAMNMHCNENNMSMKPEPLSDNEFNPDDIQLMQTNYNGSQSFYPNIDPNILHPDVIVDTDNLSDCSSSSMKSKRKMSTSTDGGDSTNYELIEYLKRREKRDEEMLKRQDAREERLINLLERTVVAIELLTNQWRKTPAEVPRAPTPPSPSINANGSSETSTSDSSDKVEEV